MDYVIFAIDKGYDLHTKAKFLRHVDTLRSMGKMDGNMKLVIGSYKGRLEDSYIIQENDFNMHVLDSGFVDKQETFMFVGRQRWMPYWIETKDQKVLQKGNLRSMHYIPDGVKDWTYRPDLNTYWFDAKEAF